MSVEKRVVAYLELATKDVEAAELLVAGGNRYAAYHVQQAVEKLTKGALLAKGIEAGIEHRFEELFKRFTEDDPGRAGAAPFLSSTEASALQIRRGSPRIALQPRQSPGAPCTIDDSSALEPMRQQEAR